MGARPILIEEGRLGSQVSPLGRLQSEEVRIVCSRFELSAFFAGVNRRMEQTVKEGQLFKRGKINTDFKQRHFILNGKQLAYFKGSVSTSEMEHVKGFIVVLNKSNCLRLLSC